MKPPPWPSHIQRTIDIEDRARKRTWEEQKKAFGLFAYAAQIEQNLEPIEVQQIRKHILWRASFGGTDYAELQPWMAEEYLSALQNFQNYVI